jgi:hypothetical protein
MAIAIIIIVRGIRMALTLSMMDRNFDVEQSPTHYAVANSTGSISVASSASAFELLSLSAWMSREPRL